MAAGDAQTDALGGQQPPWNGEQAAVEPTYADVFVQAVKDHLDGTPHANHPVQFVPANSGDGDVVCTLCRGLVQVGDADAHRAYHDRHNKEHARIMEQAQRHVPEPRYGGR